MNATMIRGGLLGVLFLVQLATPAAMLLRQEMVLERGELYRFACAPVDPADVLRGRYVALGFEASSIDVPDGASFRRGETVYVRVTTGDDGYAVLSEPTTAAPEEGAYLRTTVRWGGGNEVRVRIPFDRYYLEESIAPEIERRYRDEVRDGVEAYAEVRILNGRPALEAVYLDGKPLH